MLHRAVTDWIRRGLKDQRGQDLAEYGMLIGLIALIVVGAVQLLGLNLFDVFNNIAASVGPWAPVP